MLIEFAVSNFKSIKEESRLSLVAGPDKEHESTHVSAFTPSGGARPIPLLRSAVIYGANAAGKTNLLLGLKTMHDIVLRSSGNLDELPVIPFLFDSECGQQPTSFEVTCVTGGVRYQYGVLPLPRPRLSRSGCTRGQADECRFGSNETALPRKIAGGSLARSLPAIRKFGEGRHVVKHCS